MEQGNLLDYILMQAHTVEMRANGLASDMAEILEAALKDIVTRLAELQTGYIDFDDLTAQAKLERLKLQRSEIEKVLQEVYASMKEPMLKAGKDVYTYAQKATIKAVAPLLEIPIGKPILFTGIVEKWFEMSTVEGLTINEWLKKLEINAAERIIKAGRQAMIESMTIPETMRFMKKEGIEGSIPGLKGLARTYCMSAANYAKEETIKQSFGDFIKGWQYLATLDGRTCPVCGADDLRKFKASEDKPSLPRHWNCRCTYLPLTSMEDKPHKITDKERQDILDSIQEDMSEANKRLKEYYKTAEYNGHRNAVQHSKRTVHHRDKSKSTLFKPEKGEIVAGDMDYDSWLRHMLQKDPKFVKGILGKTRYELFKAEKITMQKMVTHGKLKRIADLI